MKKTYFITLLSALYTTTAISATPTCEPMPSCESLGYSSTVSDSCENVLSCPFDTNYKVCLDYKVIPTRGYCKIGDVFYADGTCGKVEDYYDDGVHIPVGVVVYLTDESGNVVSTATSRHGKVINLHTLYLQKDFVFDPENPYRGYYEFPWGIRNVSTTLIAYSKADLKTALLIAKGNEGSADVFDGVGNTKILSEIEACTSEDPSYYARYCISLPARSAVSFYPTPALKDDPNVGQGKWYWPSKGEQMQMTGRTDSEDCMTFTHGDTCNNENNPMQLVNVTLSKLSNILGSDKAESAVCYYHWSSTIMNYASAYDTELCAGLPSDWLKSNLLRIRLLLAF